MEKTFRQFVERQVEQGSGLLGEVGRKQFVNRTVFDEQLALGNRIAVHGALVEFCDSRLGQQVVGMGKHMECLNEQADADGDIETEGFVADNTYLRHVSGEKVCH